MTCQELERRNKRGMQTVMGRGEISDFTHVTTFLPVPFAFRDLFGTSPGPLRDLFGTSSLSRSPHHISAAEHVELASKGTNPSTLISNKLKHHHISQCIVCHKANLKVITFTENPAFWQKGVGDSWMIKRFHLKF